MRGGRLGEPVAGERTSVIISPFGGKNGAPLRRRLRDEGSDRIQCCHMEKKYHTRLLINIIMNNYYVFIIHHHQPIPVHC